MTRARGQPARALALAAALLLGLTGLYLWGLGGTAPPVGGAWTLTRGDGAVVSNRDYRGQYLLIYFGYTSCADICPTTLAAMTNAVARLQARGARVQPLFITVDPLHDTTAVIQRYVAGFGAGLVGLTGTPAQIDAARDGYGIKVVAHPTSGAGRSLDHSSVLLLIGPDGRLVAPLPASDTGPEIAARLVPYLT